MVSSDALTAGEVGSPRKLPDWVVFYCGVDLFAVPLLATREIVPPVPLTRLPGCGREVAGLIGLRGRVITVFDLGIVLGAGSAIVQPDYRIVVVDDGERTAGFAVDRIEEIARGEAAVLSPPGAEAPASLLLPGEVVGVGRLGPRPYVALEHGALLGRLLA